MPQGPGGCPTTPSSHAKANLGTGALPLVGGHNQVGDDEEDVLPLRNQRGTKEPPSVLLGTLLPRAALQGVGSLHGARDNGAIKSVDPIRPACPLTSESLSRCPIIGSFEAHTCKLPPPHKPLLGPQPPGPRPDQEEEEQSRAARPWPR